MWKHISRLFGRIQPQVSLLDEASISEVPVEYLGEIGIELKDTIELSFDEGVMGIGNINSMVITPDQSFIFTDLVSYEVHEFSLRDGRYIRSFGRRGEGPGEYRMGFKVTMDPMGYIYVYDPVTKRLLRYDRKGVYLDHTRTRAVKALLGTRDSDLLLLAQDYPANRLVMQKITPKNWQEKYSIGLSRKNNDHPNIRSPNWLVYHNTLNRVYFLGSNDYQVKEIDVATGKVLCKFGRRPPDFVPLEEQYYKQKFNRPNEQKELLDKLLQITRLNRLVLLNEQYLIVFHIKVRPLPNTKYWAVYDITSTDTIKAYSLSLSDEVEDSLIRGMMTTWKNRLYLFKNPSTEMAETSNGTMEVYALSLP